MTAPTRRDQIVAATLSVLAERGTHGLTHRAVDAHAGLPRGTASNYFRTRKALLTAAQDRFTSISNTMLSALGDPPKDEKELIERLAAVVDRLADDRRSAVMTVCLLSYEAAVSPELAAPLAADFDAWNGVYVDWLRRLGAPDPEFGGPTLNAYMLGLFISLHVDPDLEIDSVDMVAPMVSALLHGT